MSHQIETITAGDRHRVTVHADLDADCPREVTDPATGAYTYGVDARADVPAGPDDLNIVGMLEHCEDRVSWRHSFLEATARWARIFHQVTVVDDGRTLWWASPAWMANAYSELVRGTPEYIAAEQEVITADQREYQQWADGNVYGIVVEHSVYWKRVSPGEPDRLITWETVDSRWGIYFSTEYPTTEEVLRYVKQELELDDAATAAFSALNDSQEASA